MAQKTNIRSIRFLDELAELILFPKVLALESAVSKTVEKWKT